MAEIFMHSIAGSVTICLQMKKFTLHLEQDHVSQLEQMTFNGSEQCHINDQINIEKLAVSKNIFMKEIKIENSVNDEVSEMQETASDCSIKTIEKDHIFQDPLETCEAHNTDLNKVTCGKDVEAEYEPIFNDDDMKTLSDDYDDQLENDSDISDNGKISESDNKTNNNTPKFLREKKIIVALIDAYRKKPQLWDPKLEKNISVKQRKSLLQSITTGLNAKLNLNLEYYTVKKKLSFLCNQYEKEFRKQNRKVKTCNGEVCSVLWFYEHMNFLKPAIESPLKRKQKKSNKKLKPLSEDVLCKIIEIYKNYNCLWDVNNIAYTVKEKRNESIQSMADHIKTKLNLSLNLEKLENNLRFIHNSIANDKKDKIECEAKRLEFKPKCSYFEKCDFLEAHQAPFKCPYCSEIFITYQTFQVHKSEHEGSFPFTCQECGMGFKKSGNYTLHVKRHLHVFKFRCEVCGKGYPINYELEMHMRAHTGDLPYLCSICGEGFRNANNYENHVRRHEKRFRYSCHICKKGFNVLVTLNDHVKAHLNVRDIICTECGKAFTSRKYLNYHKLIHGAKKYTCNVCGKSYAQDAGLRQHKKIHGTRLLV